MNDVAGRLLLLTDGAQSARGLVDQVAAAVEGGARRVVLREKHLAVDQRRRLAGALSELLAVVGGQLIVADPAWTVDACHLSAGFAIPRPRPTVVGRSIHAGAPMPLDVDHVTFSPIWPSASKPGYGPARGLEDLSRVCAAGPVPVYALGGVDTARRAAACRAAGAFGVAVMGSVMRAPDPAPLVRGLLDALAVP